MHNLVVCHHAPVLPDVSKIVVIWSGFARLASSRR